MKIVYTKKFLKLLDKLPFAIQAKAAEKAKVFESTPFHSSLKTHKLSGRMKEYYAFSVNQQYRIVFRYLQKDKVVFLLIGTHSIYK